MITLLALLAAILVIGVLLFICLGIGGLGVILIGGDLIVAVIIIIAIIKKIRA